MKTKLYHKFVKITCKSLGITRQQLFSRKFDPCILDVYKFNDNFVLVKDPSKLVVIGTRHPLSQLYDCYQVHRKWLVKYWKHSHWKPYIQMRLDLGEKLNDILASILRNEAK